MRLHIITVGEPKHEYAKIGCGLYLKRLERYHKLKITRIKDSKKSGETAMLEEGQALLEAAGRAYTIALDPRGKQFSTEALTAQISSLGVNGEGELAFLVGGDEGLSDEVRSSVRMMWSLSSLTMPHDLAQLVMLEALYRAATLERGEPYHK
jgi:23S rRNA (pseudouridine1915-N3)-methyltransferase